MKTKEFDGMIAFDFSNLNSEQNGNDNCFSCDTCDSGGGCNCDSCDSGCDSSCDSCNCDCPI